MSPRLLWPFPPMWGLVGWSGQKCWYTEAEHPLQIRGNWAGQHLSLCPESKCWLWQGCHSSRAHVPLQPSCHLSEHLNSMLREQAGMKAHGYGWSKPQVILQEEAQAELCGGSCSSRSLQRKGRLKSPHKHRQNLHSSFHQIVSFASCSAPHLQILTSSWAWVNIANYQPSLAFLLRYKLGSH